MSVRIQLMGELEVRKQKKLELVLAGKEHAKAIREKLASLPITPIERLDDQGILYHAKEFARICTEHRQVLSEIKKIEEELG